MASDNRFFDYLMNVLEMTKKLEKISTENL